MIELYLDSGLQATRVDPSVIGRDAHAGMHRRKTTWIWEEERYLQAKGHVDLAIPASRIMRKYLGIIFFDGPDRLMPYPSRLPSQCSVLILSPDRDVTAGPTLSAPHTELCLRLMLLFHL